MDLFCSSNIKAITGTMKLHQLHTDEKLNVLCRDLSCFYQRPTICNCYALRRCKFSPLKTTASTKLRSSQLALTDDIIPCIAVADKEPSILVMNESTSIQIAVTDDMIFKLKPKNFYRKRSAVQKEA